MGTKTLFLMETTGGIELQEMHVRAMCFPSTESFALAAFTLFYRSFRRACATFLQKTLSRSCRQVSHRRLAATRPKAYPNLFLLFLLSGGVMLLPKVFRGFLTVTIFSLLLSPAGTVQARSEERRVGKECSGRW